MPGIPVYINTHTLSTIHREEFGKPGLYLSHLLKELVPNEVLALPYVTARGSKPGTVGLPSQLFKALKG